MCNPHNTTPFVHKFATLKVKCEEKLAEEHASAQTTCTSIFHAFYHIGWFDGCNLDVWYRQQPKHPTAK